jgi:D-alanine-D-alanine ligase-like ATP-grasp enzyme
MKICVLQSSYEGSTFVFKDVDTYAEVGVWMPEHSFTRAFIKKSTAVMQIRDLSKQGFDVFVNLCDGGFDEDRAGVEVVQALERYNLAFTGANSFFYEPSKEHMKMAAQYAGVKTPSFVFAYDEEGIEAATQLDFPLIVKHFNGGGSIGMSRKSRVENREQLYEMSNLMIKQFGGALIEEFIEGREFTVLVCENPEDDSKPIALMPVECIFGQGETFKHFDLKWVNHVNIDWVPCTDEKLKEKLKDLTRKVFVGLHGVSYGRADIRVDKNNEPYFLEMNPNCGIFYPKEEAGSADFILFNDPSSTHRSFLEHIIKCALKRHKERSPKYEVCWYKNSGYGLYAKEIIKEGETIIKNEEKPQFLVSKSEFECWNDPVKRSWVDKCAYPISDDVYVVWGENPIDWKPINHSCDPTAWFSRLNIVARKTIQKHQQITLDYAMFCGEMSSFQCLCGSSNCRKQIKGTDYRESWIIKQYEGHISDWVKSKQQKEN